MRVKYSTGRTHTVDYLNILHLCLYMRYIELLTAGDEAHNFNMASTFPLTESSE